MAPTGSDVATTPDAEVLHSTQDPRAFDPPRPALLDPDYQRVVAEISELARLRENWDSYGANPIDSQARANAVTLVTMVATHVPKRVPPPIVGPSTAGGVVLRWEPRDLEVVVTVLSRGGEYYVAERHTDRVLEEGEVGRPEAFVARVSEFLAH
ncbi:MAG: hypothetical protein HYS14_00070 [Candidatus Rokubacteria bacterium]|nr:hypothetical protein [Candidatus Rokubacteria bacterium]